MLNRSITCGKRLGSGSQKVMPKSPKFDLQESSQEDLGRDLDRDLGQDLLDSYLGKNRSRIGAG